MHCEAMGIIEFPLHAVDRDDAQAKAVACIQENLKRIIQDLKALNTY